jgi:hypothetical protein
MTDKKPTNSAEACVPEQPAAQLQPVSDPWGLTSAQVRVMNSICDHGCHKLAARALGLSVKTVELHAWQVGLLMKSGRGLAKYLAWDRFRSGRATSAQEREREQHHEHPAQQGIN